MARSFLETACQPNPGRSRPHSLGPMLVKCHVLTRPPDTIDMSTVINPDVTKVKHNDLD